MPSHAHLTPLPPVSPGPAADRPPRSWAPTLACAALLVLACYGAARLPWWPLVLAALASVVLALAAEQLQAVAAAQPRQTPRHHRARAPRTRHRRDPRAGLVVATPWCAA